MPIDDRADGLDELRAIAQRRQHAPGHFAALALVLVADVRLAPVAAEAVGDDLFFIDVGPAGVVQQGGNKHQGAVRFRIGVAQATGEGQRNRQVDVVAAGTGFRFHRGPDLVQFAVEVLIQGNGPGVDGALRRQWPGLVQSGHDVLRQSGS
ncbi:hypothetical protein D3C74_379730 [compost metagenome]